MSETPDFNIGRFDDVACFTKDEIMSLVDQLDVIRDTLKSHNEELQVLIVEEMAALLGGGLSRPG